MSPSQQRINRAQAEDEQQQKAAERDRRNEWRDAHPVGWNAGRRHIIDQAKEENWSSQDLAEALGEKPAEPPPATTTTEAGTTVTDVPTTSIETTQLSTDEQMQSDLMNNYGLTAEEAAQETSDYMQQQMDYDPTYWQAPERIARWYHAIQATPPGTSLPEWMSPELQGYIEETYKYMQWRNGGAPESEWKYLNADDGALQLLAALETPPADFLWEGEERFAGGKVAGEQAGVTVDMVKNGEALWSDVPEAQRTAVLNDPSFDIWQFPPEMRGQLLADPAFNWDNVPAWQKTLFNLQSNPLIGGAVQGLLMGGVPGAVVGGGLGVVSEKTGYNPNKYFWQQGDDKLTLDMQQVNDLVNGVIGFLNDAGQAMEQAAGYVAQVGDAAIAEATGVEEAKGATARYLFDPKYRSAAWQAGRVLAETSQLDAWMTNVAIVVGLSKDAVLKALNGDMSGFAQGFRGVDWLKNNERMTLGSNKKATVSEYLAGEVMQEMRLAIVAEVEAGGDPQTVIDKYIQEYSATIGAPLADLVAQSVADPLDVMVPQAIGKTISTGLKVTGGDLVPAFKGGWDNPSKVIGEWKALAGQIEAAKAAELPAVSRWMAGLNKSGEITAGAAGLFPNETLTRTTPQEGMKGWVQRMMTLAPENRAKMAMSLAADHLGAIASHLTPDEFNNFFKSLQKMDMEAAKNIAGDVVGSAEFYTVIPMMRGFDLDAMKVSMWDVSAENRGLMLRVADVLGMEAGRLVEDLGQPNSAARVFEQLRQMVMKSTDKAAKTLLEDMDAGRFTVKDLEQIGRTFNGPDALPWHPAQFQAMALDAFKSHAEKWAVDYFKIKPGSFASQIAKTLKGVQSVLLLGYSPKYIIDNVINGEVTMAASGVYGMMSMKQIDAWTKRFGFTPDRMADSGMFGHLGIEGAKGKGSAIADAMRSKGALGQVQQTISKFGEKYTITPLAGKMEGMQGARAMTVGMKQMWGKVWERGRGFSKMDAGLESSLRAIDPLLPEMVYRAIEGGISQKEVMDALTVRQAGVKARDLITGAAQKMGMSNSQAITLLEQAGIMDALDGYLKTADTPEKVDAAFRSVMKRAEGWIDARKGQELRHKAEHVANALTSEGENRMWEVILDNVGYRNDQWITHYMTADEVAATVEAMPDEFQGQKSLAWLDWYEKEQRAWTKTNTDVLTNLKGVMQALGLTHPDAQKLLTLMGEEFDTWGKAYDFRLKQYAEHYEQWKGKFGQETIETRMLELEQRGALIDEEFQKAFTAERVKEEQVRDILVEMVRAKYGDAVADVTMKAYQQTIDFRAEMTGVLKKHRKDVKNLWGADRRAANRKFYQDDYLYRVVDMRRVWEDGVGKVQDATKGDLGTAGTPTRSPMPPTRPSPEPVGMAEPMAQTRPVVSETPPPAPPQMGTFGEGGKSATPPAVLGLDTATPTRPASVEVWKIASENGMSGLDRNGNQVFGAKLDVIKFVKKWGGAEGGAVKRFDDITPEIMQKAVDAKAAWLKDQMELMPKVDQSNVEGLKSESEALPEPSEKTNAAAEEAVQVAEKANEEEFGQYDPRRNPVYKTAITRHISELDPVAFDALQYELYSMRARVNNGEPGYRIHTYNLDAPGSTTRGVSSTYPDWYGPLKREKKFVLAALDALIGGKDKPETGLYTSLKAIAADLLANDPVMGERWDWAKAWGYEKDIIFKFDREVSHAVDDFYRQASEGNAWLMEMSRERMVQALAEYPKEALDSFVQMLDENGKFVDGTETYRQYHERLWNEADKLYQQAVSEKLNAQAEIGIREAEARGEMAMTREVLREQMIEEAGLPAEQADVLLEMFDANAKTYGPKYGLTPEQFYNRIYGGITKGGLGEMQQTAYHGTPYKFDKFSLDHMGSGEGAQAYGWGLYFAGDKSVANWYREKLKRSDVMVDGKEVAASLSIVKTQEAVVDALGYAGREAQVAKSILNYYLSGTEWKTIEKIDFYDNTTAKAILPDLKARVSQTENTGQLYAVEIPDENYLLWDRPLSEQPSAVREALEKLMPGLPDKDWNTGEKIYKSIGGKEAFTSQSARDKAASLALREAGISGIKYLDGSSRGKGEGNYNYVIFDDAAIQIKETYYQIAPINRRMSSVEVESYARALVRAGEGELRRAVQNEPNPADRVAILDAAHSLDPKMAEAVGSTARLYQENKGAVTMMDDMQGLIHAYEASDFSTFVHEPAHIFLRQLMNFDQALPEYRDAIAKDWKAVQDWVKVEQKGNTWEAINGEGKHSIREDDGLFYYRGSSGEEYVFATFEEAQARMTDEMFARGFEKYITEGSAPTKGLARVFEMAKQWMVGIYRAIVGSQIDVKITDEIRAVFDRLLTDEPITRESVDMQAQVDALMKETGVDMFAGTKEMAKQKAEGGRQYDAGADAYNRLAEIGQTDEKAINASRLDYRKQARELNRRVDDLTAARERAGVDAWNRPVSNEIKQSVIADLNAEIQNAKAKAAEFTSLEKAMERYIADLKAGTVKAPKPDTFFQKAPPTRSEAFKRWFGNSKVVDEKGDPLVVYHGTGAEFEAFDLAKVGSYTDTGMFGKGFYFSDSPVLASSYANEAGNGANVKPVYLSLKNPLEIDDVKKLPVIPEAQTIDEMRRAGNLYSERLRDKLIEQGYDGVVMDWKSKGKKEYVAFYPEQIKSVNNRGTFDPTNPNILFQKAELPLGGMDQASGFIPEGAILDEAYTSQLKPLLEAMQAEGRTGLDTLRYSTTEGGGRFDQLTPELQAQLMAYAKKVTKREMPAAKLAAVRYGEGMRDWALLNYNKKYGFDKAIENVVPYQFWATRTGMNSALRVFDRPAWFANYFRLQRFASRYERDLPDRLKGKIKIELPFLPEWTGRALYVDPFKQLFPWIQYGQPFDQLRKDKNAQTFEAERVLQEWAADETYSESEITQAAQSRAGSVWDAAVAEAALRRKAEISSPLDFMATLLGPAWYLTMPAKALGLEIPFINSQGEGAESIGLTTMTRTGIAMQQATAGTWAEPLGKLAGMLAKPEQWLREKNGLPEFGEYGEYYIDRQLANLVAEGLVTVDDAKRAMIERSGEAYDMATDRVRTEIMLRTPTAMSVYAGTHGGVGDLLASLPASVLGGGILPEGELRFRGLKEKWNAAWEAYDRGDTQAIGQFFEDHPEYEVYLMKGQSPDERLRNMLTSQIWDAYMGLDKATRRVVTAQLGAQFEHSFLNSETRSPESLSLETLSRWSMMLGHKPPQPPTEGQGAVDVNMPKPDEIPMLEGLPTETRTAMGDYEAAKAEQFPNISQLQNLYFSSSDEDKKRIISIYPELREYWDWKRQYIEANPAAAPFLDKDVAQGIISGELNSWDYGLSPEQADRLIGYYNNEYSVPVKTADYYLENATPFLLESLSAHQLMGTDLTEGAYKELRVIWEGFGMPGEGFDDWLENVIYATWGW